MKNKQINDKFKIYLVAPSFGCSSTPYKERLEASIKVLESLGHKIVIGPNVWLAEGIASSNTPQLRAKEIMDAFLSDCDVVMSVGGGELMCEILEYIDFKKIKKNPKLYLGYSDNTFLTYTLTTILGIETIYGPNAPSFYMYPFKYNILDTYEMILGKNHFESYDKWELTNDSEDPLPEYNLTEDTNIIPINYKQSVTGILLGGCLDCLTYLVGTEYDYTKSYSRGKKIIFFLEACDLNSVGIKRALLQLKRAGWFDNVVMFLIGRSLQYNDESFGLSTKEAYINELVDYNVPILLDVDLGHLHPAMPFKCGAKATISYDKKLIIDYEK